MPTKPPRMCPCGALVPGGQRCPHCTARARKAHDTRRPSAGQRGYGAAWQKARAEFLAVHRSCAFCGRPSDTVDHITPHRGNSRLFWDRTNWQALCSTCHSSRKQAMEKRA